MKRTDRVVIVAIIGLAIMQIVAMYYGVNGTFRTYVVATIAGLAGWRIPIKN